MKTVHIALIGCGEIAQLHAQALHKTGAAQIVAAFDRQPEKAQEFSRLYGAETYTDLNSLLNRPDVEAVYILTRHDSHAEYIHRALAANKHVFCEKPLTLTLQEAFEVKRNVQASDRFFMVGFNHRWNPAVRWLRKWIQTENSPIRVVHITFTTSPYLESWAGMAEEGGGILPSMASHAVDLGCTLLDETPAYVVAITARLRLPAPYLPDTAGIIMKMPSGALCTVTTSDHAAPSYPHYAVPGPSYLMRVEVFSERWTAIIENSHQIVLFTDEVRTIRLEEKDPLDTIGILPEDEYFIECLQSGIKPIPNERDGIRAVQLMCLAAEAARTGSTLKIEKVS